MLKKMYEHQTNYEQCTFSTVYDFYEDIKRAEWSPKEIVDDHLTLLDNIEISANIETLTVYSRLYDLCDSDVDIATTITGGKHFKVDRFFGRDYEDCHVYYCIWTGKKVMIIKCCR